MKRIKHCLPHIGISKKIIFIWFNICVLFKTTKTQPISLIQKSTQFKYGSQIKSIDDKTHNIFETAESDELKR